MQAAQNNGHVGKTKQYCKRGNFLDEYYKADFWVQETDIVI